MKCQYCGLETTLATNNGLTYSSAGNHSSTMFCFEALQNVIANLTCSMQHERGRAERNEEEKHLLENQLSTTRAQLRSTQTAHEQMKKSSEVHAEREAHALNALDNFLAPIETVLNQEAPPNEVEVRYAKDLAVEGMKYVREHLPKGP
jgi:hypothetical protein